KLLREKGDAGSAAAELRQEARREGKQIAFSLVNRTNAGIVVPLRFAPDRADLPAFFVLAEDEHHAVFELASPSLEMPAQPGMPEATRLGDPNVDASVARRVYSARIRLPPGAAAHARIVPNLEIAKRL